MTREQLKELLSLKISLVAYTNKKPQVWINAFKEYNADEKNINKLSMASFPCYEKVLMYHVNKRK